jgi:hypothetical protein
MAGLGTVFVGLETLSVQAGAVWDLAGANSLANSSMLLDAGTLTVAGSLADAGAVTLKGGDLAVAAGASVKLGGLTLNGGVLQSSASGTLVVGTSAGAAGAITVSGDVSGFGTITGAAVTDTGTVTASGGTLSIMDAVTGTGTLALAADATVLAGAGVSGVTIDFAANGTLALAEPASVTSTISGFQSGDVVDLQKLIANTLTYSGGRLTLSDGSTVVDTLSFAGSYTQSDFSLQSDKHGGTDVLYAGTQAPDFASTVLRDEAGAGAFRAPAGLQAFWHAGEAALPAWFSAGVLSHAG